MRRSALVVGGVALLLAIAAALWTPVAVPRLVRLPSDFSTTVGTSGTFEAFVAPGSFARLASSASLPMTATLAVATTEADDDVVVIGTTLTQKVGDPSGPTQDLELKGQYVVDRRSAQNVDDPRAWSMTPDHKVNRAGSYSFTFGFAFDPDATYPFWDDSIAAAYPLRQGGSSAQADTGGLNVTGMEGSISMHPADPVWVSQLKPLAPPTSLTPEQWKDAGFDVTGDGPVDVEYFVSIETQVSVNDLAGGTVNLTELQLTLAYRPDPKATGGTAADPKQVFVTKVAESSDSVATDTAMIADDSRQIALAERWIPLGLAVGAVLLGAIAVLLQLRRRGGDPEPT